MLLTLIAIGISTVMPAQGVWDYLHLSALESPAIVPITRDLPLPVFFGLRDGTFRHLVAEGAEGIISFPSLHAGLGLLFAFALWPIGYIGWISLLLNLMMIAATPVDGSHYFSDVLAGLTIAALSWISVRYGFTQIGLPRTNWLMKVPQARLNLQNATRARSFTKDLYRIAKISG
jgi:membrane-associated phospholipid phosphatase